MASASSWTSLFSKLVSIVEEITPFESLLPHEAATIASAIGTIVTTLAGKSATPPAA